MSRERSRREDFISDERNLARCKIEEGGLIRQIPLSSLIRAVLETAYIPKTIASGFAALKKLPQKGRPRDDLSELQVHPRKSRKKLVILFDDIESCSVQEMMESNVANIYRMLKGNELDQLCFYRAWTPKTTLKEIVMDGYKFLVKHFEGKNDIFFFNYSKGAYAAKVLSTIIRSLGILRPELEDDYLISEAWRVFHLNASAQMKMKPHSEPQSIASNIKRSFADCFARDAITSFSGFFDATDPYFFKEDASILSNIFFQKLLERYDCATRSFYR
ncbi:hypothetical protein N7488_011178 [Penicillium malachiteum]|nr:hypothetical protein N7488_011178 [Penicillium malachiteum]